MFSLFHVRPLLSGGVVLLSDKRLHGFRLAGALLATPHILVVSGPFVKLSTPAHRLLFSLLSHLAGVSSMRVVLILSVLSSVPSFVARIVPISGVRIFPGVRHRICLSTFHSESAIIPFSSLRRHVVSLPCGNGGCSTSRIMGLGGIDVHCNSHAVLGRLS